MGEVLTVDWLCTYHACRDGIDFIERNKLIGFPFSCIDKIDGRHSYVDWVSEVLDRIAREGVRVEVEYTESMEYGLRIRHCDIGKVSECWKKLDANGNTIYYRSVHSGWESWYAFDERGNRTYEKSGRDGRAEWTEYNDNDDIVYVRRADGFEKWFKYEVDKITHWNSNGYRTVNTFKDGEVIKFESSLDGMGYERSYDAKGKLLHHREESGFELWVECTDRQDHYRDTDGLVYVLTYDAVGNIIDDGDGLETPTEFYANGQLKSIGSCIFPLMGDII